MTLVRSFIASTLHKGRTLHLIYRSAASAYHAERTDDYDQGEKFNQGVGSSADDTGNI